MITPHCALLLLPGLEGTSILFEPLIAELPAWVRPVTVEYPLTGPMEYADLLSNVRAAVPADLPFVVLGWSFGGPLAVLLGADPPPGLRGIIIASSFVTCPLPWLRWLRPLIRSPLVPVYGLLSRLKARLWGYGDSEFRALQRRTYQAIQPRAFAARIRTALAADVRQELLEVRVPILYLAASHDVVVPTHCVAGVHNLRPDMQFEEIPGPHVALVLAATEAARRIVPFIARACREAAASN